MEASTNQSIGFSFSHTFDFEKTFDRTSSKTWMDSNWTLSFWYSLVYIIVVFGGKNYMDKRPRFELRAPLAAWSLVLGIFSICGAIRTGQEMVYVLQKHGFQFSICDNSFYTGPTAFWIYLFTISKAYELGDTVFIVLRKQPLIFLHWYHHILTMVYVWFSYTEYTSTGRWGMAMNYTVHSVMYTYYALKAMKIYVPRTVSMLITSLQLTQFLMGMVVLGTAIKIKSSGQPCGTTMENLIMSTMMYFSYLVLFSNFFYQSYIKKRQRSRTDVANNNNGVEKKVQ